VADGVENAAKEWPICDAALVERNGLLGGQLRERIAVNHVHARPTRGKKLGGGKTDA
jgi:hypothetical protein